MPDQTLVIASRGLHWDRLSLNRRSTGGVLSRGSRWSRGIGLMLAAICLAQLGCGGQEGGSDQSSVFPLALHPVSTTVPAPSAALAQEEDGEEQEMETATFAGGCFWCTEAVFLEVNGVKSVESGYTGGRIEFPTYQQVCTGRTGHAEAIRIKYDPELVSYEVLLEIFFKTHDPTTLNRQGADVGTQYRSAVFYHNEEQRRIAAEIKQKLDDAEIWNRPIVTRLEEAKEFYVAEDYHQNYFNRNSRQGYCQAVIVPKLEKFREVFAEHLKTRE